MHMSHLLRWVAASTFIAALWAPPDPNVRAAGQPLLVVVSTATPLTDASTALLRRVFQGEVAEYASGKRLIPVNHPLNSPGRTRFDRIVLGLGPDEVGRFWVDRRIRDQSGPPRTLPSADIALRFVMSMPGGITYLASDQLNDKVRALTIDGKAAGAPGYLLGD
jgi:hypothetical protein